MKVTLTKEARATIKPKPVKTHSSLAKLLLELRLQANMSQGDVAEVIGLTRTSVTNMEGGRQPVTIEAVDSLAQHLGLELVITVQKSANTSSEQTP